MKNLYLLIAVLLVISGNLFAQVGINTDSSAPDNSVMLDVKSSAKGMIFPGKTSEQEDDNKNSNKTLNITCLLQGLYNGGGTMNKAQDEYGDYWPGTIADQITIELRSTNWDVAYTLANIDLNTDGTAVGSVPTVHSGNYYINIKHRNSIETCSSIPVSFAGGTINYNFTTDGSQAYGSNMKLMPDGYWTFYGGDEDQDGLVDATDMINVDNDASTFTAGYITTDVNGDGLVDSGDMILVDNNASNFVYAKNPACGSDIIINHIAGLIAPVSKTVTYGTINNIPGEPAKCWITSNLGADHQATAVNDATEASAGWYWQFNRKQGYKHDGTTRTPNTTWINSINENLDWQTTNDPCSIELGTGWRLPTYTEWYNVDNIGGWVNWNGPWNSGLKMHAAGYLNYTNGSLDNCGSAGGYWSSIQNSATFGWHLAFNSGYSSMNGNYNKAIGFAARCVRD